MASIQYLTKRLMVSNAENLAKLSEDGFWGMFKKLTAAAKNKLPADEVYFSFNKSNGKQFVAEDFKGFTGFFRKLAESFKVSFSYWTGELKKLSVKASDLAKKEADLVLKEANRLKEARKLPIKDWDGLEKALRETIKDKSSMQTYINQSRLDDYSLLQILEKQKETLYQLSNGRNLEQGQILLTQKLDTLLKRFGIKQVTVKTGQKPNPKLMSIEKGKFANTREASNRIQVDPSERIAFVTEGGEALIKANVTVPQYRALKNVSLTNQQDKRLYKLGQTAQSISKGDLAKSLAAIYRGKMKLKDLPPNLQEFHKLTHRLINYIKTNPAKFHTEVMKSEEPQLSFFLGYQENLLAKGRISKGSELNSQFLARFKRIISDKKPKNGGEVQTMFYTLSDGIINLIRSSSSETLPQTLKAIL